MKGVADHPRDHFKYWGFSEPYAYITTNRKALENQHPRPSPGTITHEKYVSYFQPHYTEDYGWEWVSLEMHKRYVENK